MIDAGGVDDFREGKPRLVSQGKRVVGVIRWGDEFFALRNVCPHQSGPLCQGVVEQKIVSTGTVGGMAVKKGQAVVICPWHGWEFGLQTGRALTSDLRVATYAVQVEDGRVLVDLSRADRS